MNRQQQEITRRYKKRIGKGEQRAELLKRSGSFVQELTDIKRELDLAFFRFMKKHKDNPYVEGKIRIKIGKWQDFCQRWHIKSGWMGSLDNLSNYQRDSAEVWIEENSTAGNWSILLKMNSWATIEDVKEKWNEVEKLQKEELFGKVVGKDDMGRDLCWRDLSRICRLSPSKIAELWESKCNDDLNLLIIQKIGREIVRDLKNIMLDEEKADSLCEDLGLSNLEELKLVVNRVKIMNDQELLGQVVRGQLANRYESLFNQEKSFYVEGKGSGTKPFVERIKKAIKRVERQIKQLEERPRKNFPLRHRFIA